ncbi:MAG: hypothetical protein OXS47_04340 [Chloroflexota bacterium]|nr:hypothetical protein [Chloroflexota bacterium]
MPTVHLESATTNGLDHHGALGPAWGQPAPFAPERRRLHFLARGDTLPEGRAGDFQ